MSTSRASVVPSYRTLISLIPLSVAVGATWKLWLSGNRRMVFDREPLAVSQQTTLRAHRHPTYWFDDGSLIVEVSKRGDLGEESPQDLVLFKIHERLFRRHSVYAQRAVLERGEMGVSVMTIPSGLGVQVQDFTLLLEHLYHDTPLSPQAPFHHVASILRISSPNQLDIPSIHGLARDYLVAMFPSGPAPFVHPSHLEEAIHLAVQYKISSIQKGIYYSLVTTTDFEPDSDAPETAVENPVDSDRMETRHRHGGDVLSVIDIERCRNLMAGIVEHFTPVLFEPPVTPHMACTNLLADKWFPLVIQSAIAGDSVYKPLEALEKLKQIDWIAEGLCPACVREKREEWTTEQEEVWEKMDSWLKLELTDLK